MAGFNPVEIVIKPVDKVNWADFEAFFESNAKLKYCWCMAWRMTKDELKNNNVVCRKELIKERVWAGIPIGLLAYTTERPIAWCSIAPRETHRRLGGDGSIENVWSMTCFYISIDF